MTRIEEDSLSRVLYELCAMIIQILRCPPPVTLPFPVIYSPEPSTSMAVPSSSVLRRTAAWPSTAAASQISPASFASLFLGISLALMLFGLVAFLIGFLLMPWVIGLVLIFYFAGVLSNLSDLGRSFVCWALSPQDNVPAWKAS